MVHAVEEFGGTVKDLAGDGILALFGAPTAHEDDAERALRAAIADRRRGARVLAGRRAKLRHRITRRACRCQHRHRRRRPGRRRKPRRVRSDGDAVNVAARLQAAAPAGRGAGGRRDATRRRAPLRVGRPAVAGSEGEDRRGRAYRVNGALARPARAQTRRSSGASGSSRRRRRRSTSRRRNGIDPVRQRRARDREEPVPRGARRRRRPAALARGSLRLLRRVDAVLAVSRPAARVARARADDPELRTRLALRRAAERHRRRRRRRSPALPRRCCSG